jgi:hypothetical protein
MPGSYIKPLSDNLEKGLTQVIATTEAGSPLHSQATASLTFLGRRGSIDGQRQSRLRLIGSSANTLKLKEFGELGGRLGYEEFGMMAAGIMSRTTNPADQEIMEEYGFNCQGPETYRLAGPSMDAGDTLYNSAFAEATNDGTGRYRFWQSDSLGRVKTQTIGPEGLWARLGPPLTEVEWKSISQPCGPPLMNLDRSLTRISNDPETSASAKEKANQFRNILEIGESTGSIRQTKGVQTEIWNSDLNHKVLRESKARMHLKSHYFESMACKWVGKILMSRTSHGIVEKLKALPYDWEDGALISLAIDDDHPDLTIANSDWILSAYSNTEDLASSSKSSEAHPHRQMYEHIEIRGENLETAEITKTAEITPGQMRGMLQLQSAGANSSQERTEESMVAGLSSAARPGQAESIQKKRRRFARR